MFLLHCQENISIISTDMMEIFCVRRCGKSVMLELIKEELVESGIRSAPFISINFEDLNFSHLQTAKSLHDEITERAAEVNGKIYLFFDEIQEVKDWELSILLRGISGTVPSHRTGRADPEMLSELSIIRRYAVHCQHPLRGCSFQALPS